MPYNFRRVINGNNVAEQVAGRESSFTFVSDQYCSTVATIRDTLFTSTGWQP